MAFLLMSVLYVLLFKTSNQLWIFWAQMAVCSKLMPSHVWLAFKPPDLWHMCYVMRFHTYAQQALPGSNGLGQGQQSNGLGTDPMSSSTFPELLCKLSLVDRSTCTYFSAGLNVQPSFPKRKDLYLGRVKFLSQRQTTQQKVWWKDLLPCFPPYFCSPPRSGGT